MVLRDLPEDAIQYDVERDGQVAWITMNRPERLNALTVKAYKRITELVWRGEKDEDVKVIGFRGAGGVFSSGQDVEEAYDFYFEPEDDRRTRPSMRRRLLVQDGNLWGKRGMTEVIFYCLKPTVARVDHRCFGAGMDIVMACDMAICTDDTIFGHPGFTYHGFGGDLASYIHHMGMKRAKEFTLTSRPFDGKFAAEVGIVNRSVQADSLDSEIESLMDDIVKMPADALVMQKAHYRVVLDGLGFGTNFSAALQALAFASNIKYDEGDNVMVRDKEAMGVSEAIRARKEFYGHL